MEWPLPAFLHSNGFLCMPSAFFRPLRFRCTHKPHTFFRDACWAQALIHVLMERIELGCTCTLYCHGTTHVWDLPRLPISLSDEAGEAALRMLNKQLPMLSTKPDAAMDTQRREVKSLCWSSGPSISGALPICQSAKPTRTFPPQVS